MQDMSMIGYGLIATIVVVWLYVELWVYPRKKKSQIKYPVVLWLDDVRNPFKVKWMDLILEGFPELGDCEVVWVKDYDRFVRYIETNGLPEYISFDHDLGLGKSGHDCAKWLIDYCYTQKFDLNKDIVFPQYQAHSKNPVGKENILGVLSSYKRYLEKL